MAINLSCNKSQLRRVSSTVAGTTIRERRLAFFGKSHLFSHGRGKDFSEEEEVAVSGPVNEKLGKNARNRSLIDEHGRSRSISWKKRDEKRLQEIKRRMDLLILFFFQIWYLLNLEYFFQAWVGTSDGREQCKVNPFML